MCKLCSREKYMNFKQLQKYCLREKTEFLHRYQKKKKKTWNFSNSTQSLGRWRVESCHWSPREMPALPLPADPRGLGVKSQGKSKMKIHLGKGMLPLCQLLERPSAPLASPFWDTDTSPAVNLGVLLTEPVRVGANKGVSLCEAAVYKDKVRKEEGNQGIYDLLKGNPRVFLLPSLNIRFS